MNTNTAALTTATLKPGQRIKWAAGLNFAAGSGTVESVSPWMLTAGPNAGQQARSGRGKNGSPLFTVVVVDVACEFYGEPNPTTIHMAVTADAPFTAA